MSKKEKQGRGAQKRAAARAAKEAAARKAERSFLGTITDFFTGWKTIASLVIAAAAAGLLWKISSEEEESKDPIATTEDALTAKYKIQDGPKLDGVKVVPGETTGAELITQLVHAGNRVVALGEHDNHTAPEAALFIRDEIIPAFATATPKSAPKFLFIEIAHNFQDGFDAFNKTGDLPTLQHFLEARGIRLTGTHRNVNERGAEYFDNNLALFEQAYKHGLQLYAIDAPPKKEETDILILQEKMANMGPDHPHWQTLHGQLNAASEARDNRVHPVWAHNITTVLPENGYGLLFAGDGHFIEHSDADEMLGIPSFSIVRKSRYGPPYITANNNGNPDFIAYVSNERFEATMLGNLAQYQSQGVDGLKRMLKTMHTELNFLYENGILTSDDAYVFCTACTIAGVASAHQGVFSDTISTIENFQQTFSDAIDPLTQNINSRAQNIILHANAALEMAKELHHSSPSFQERVEESRQQNNSRER